MAEVTPPAEPKVPLTKQAEDALKTATVDEVKAAIETGGSMTVQFKNGVTALAFGVRKYVVDAEGLVKMFVQDAIHAAEAFGGRILSDIEVKAATAASKLQKK